MNYPKVYADLQNTDAKGRVRLNCNGTHEDIVRQNIQLQSGLGLTLYADDTDELGKFDPLLAVGFVEYSEEEQVWVAAIDWSAIHHASDGQNKSAPSMVPASNVG